MSQPTMGEGDIAAMLARWREVRTNMAAIPGEERASRAIPHVGPEQIMNKERKLFSTAPSCREETSLTCCWNARVGELRRDNHATRKAGGMVKGKAWNHGFCKG